MNLGRGVGQQIHFGVLLNQNKPLWFICQYVNLQISTLEKPIS